MKKPLTAIVLLVVAACTALAQSSKAPDELLKGFLAAVRANSYEGMVAPLVAEGGEIAAELEKPEQKAANMLSLEKLNRALAPRLAKGYAAISMGMLRYRGYRSLLCAKLDDLLHAVVQHDRGMNRVTDADSARRVEQVSRAVGIGERHREHDGAQRRRTGRRRRAPVESPEARVPIEDLLEDLRTAARLDLARADRSRSRIAGARSG